jgi:hypothetical protein
VDGARELAGGGGGRRLSGAGAVLALAHRRR